MLGMMMNSLLNVPWQCRRGMLELDVLFQRVLEKHYTAFSPTEKQLFLQLLQYDDPVLYDWLIADVPCTDEAMRPMVCLLKKLLF